MAYEIMAEWTQAAEHWHAGGLPPAGKLWDHLRPLERHDVLLALAAQARVPLRMLEQRDQADYSSVLGEAGQLDLSCGIARQALHALLAGEPEPWQLPPCGRCAGALASVLCTVQYAAWRMLGFTAAMIIAGCRLTAAAAAAS